MHLILLHSPLVGASTWAPLADACAARGVAAHVPVLPAWTELHPPYYPALAAAVEVGGPACLVAHSGAGALVPAILAEAQGLVRSVAFVDAILPHPGRSWFATAAPALGNALRAAAVEGAAPAWDQWFPAGTLGGLLPDPDQRAQFLAELTPTPLAFLEEPAPELVIPADVAWGYLRLSRAYEDEAGEARRVGAPTLRLDSHHLAMMTDPEPVLTALLNLMRMLG